jgi:hypothetical protein
MLSKLACVVIPNRVVKEGKGTQRTAKRVLASGRKCNKGHHSSTKQICALSTLKRVEKLTDFIVWFLRTIDVIFQVTFSHFVSSFKPS